MILSDISNRLQTGGDLALRPLPPLQEIADKLGELVSGQRQQRWQDAVRVDRASSPD